MAANSQFQKIISVLLIFIVMAELSGCVSSVKLIQSSDLPMKEPGPVNKYNPSAYTYFVCTRKTDNPKRNKSYIVKNISVSNGYLTADRDTPGTRLYDVVYIYVASDSLINIAPDKSVKIALNDIYKVKVQETNSFLLWGYIIVGVIGFWLLMDLIFGPLPSMPPLI
jgi:hypothetical protein